MIKVTHFFALFALNALPLVTQAQFTSLPPTCNLEIGDIVIAPPDPGDPGAFTVVIDEYGSADQPIYLPEVDYPVEFLAEVAYPEETECGPFPIVFMMHGYNETCVNSDLSVDDNWPCEYDQTALPNYKGYRYLAKILASHGIVSVSISANAINANNVGDDEARALLFQRHIGKWLEFSTLAGEEFGLKFFRKIDLKRIGILGHSRGAAGAALLVDSLENYNANLNSIIATGPSSDIKAVLLVGAAEVTTEEEFAITQAALGVVLPYCDGDQQDMGSVMYYDLSRYALAGDNGAKHSFEVIGANHNFYNTFWDPSTTDIDAVDDWIDAGYVDLDFCVPGTALSGRLSSEQQRGTLIAIGSAFFRTYLRNEKAFRSFLRGDEEPPNSAKTDQIYVAYHPKDEPLERLDLNRLDKKTDIISNTLGGDVEYDGLVRFEYCDVVNGGGSRGCIENAPEGPISGGISPHVLNSFSANQLRLAWEDIQQAPAFINNIPAGIGNVSNYGVIQFRVFVDYSDPLNDPESDQDLRIVLTDGAGLSASAVVSNYSRALFFPPALESLQEIVSPIPRAIFNTVRVPLAAFDDIYLTDIREVAFVFDQTESGAINMVDIAFADEASNKTPAVSCSIAESVIMPAGDKLVNVGLTLDVVDDQNVTPVPTVVVYSDEDDLDSENKQSSPDAKDFASGDLRLRAERDKSGDGRVYVVVSTATDNEGKTGLACCTAIVPASKMAEDITAVEAHASSARDQCTKYAAASEGLASIPSGFFPIGDGPTLGSQQ